MSKRKTWPDVYCVECKSLIVPNNANNRAWHVRRKFCSRGCIGKNKRRVHLERDARLIPDRPCASCGKSLVRRPKETLVDWEVRRYCDRQCFYVAKIPLSNASLFSLKWKQESTKNCHQCKTQMRPRPMDKFIEWCRRQFCGPECARRANSGPANPNWKEIEDRKCLACGAPFPIVLGKTRRLMRIQRYCSNACRRGIHSRSWKGGRYLADGYVVLNNNGKPRREHILIAEKALDRPLKKGEVVHHINGIKTDNRNANLLICTVAYHSWLHVRMSELYMREHFPRAA